MTRIDRSFSIWFVLAALAALQAGCTGNGGSETREASSAGAAVPAAQAQARTGNPPPPGGEVRALDRSALPAGAMAPAKSTGGESAAAAPEPAAMERPPYQTDLGGWV